MGGSGIEDINSKSREQSEVNWNQYYNDVYTDFVEMKKLYPFSYLNIPPTVKPSLAEIRVVAVAKSLLEAVCGTESDFLSEYSRELHLFIPVDYKNKGCDVYGADWVKMDKLAKEDIHFSRKRGTLIRKKYGFKICIGTPDSFSLMKNVILENVRTAENMLIAYERIMSGVSENLGLIAYAHGNKGRQQFQEKRGRYMTKRVTNGQKR